MKSKRPFILLLFFLSLILLFQNCTGVKYASQDVSLPDGLKFQDGQVFDGKLRILHHYVDGFRCEGREAPESILTRETATGGGDQWYLVKNSADKCGSTARYAVEGVIYDDTAKQAVFEGKIYIPPRQLSVSAIGDANTNDANLLDGVCADSSGRCSLKAALQQAVPNALTTPMDVAIPAGIFSISQPLILDTRYPESYAIRLIGAGSTQTIIDGGGKVGILRVHSNTDSPITVKNMTFQNGTEGTGGNYASAIYFGGRSGYGVRPFDSSPTAVLNISDCVFLNTKNAPTVLSGRNSGSMTITRARFEDSQSHAVLLYMGGGATIEDSDFIRADRGVAVDMNDTPVILRGLHFIDNYEGISLNTCLKCEISDSIIEQSHGNGIFVAFGALLSDYDVKIRNTKIRDNWRKPASGPANGSANISLAWALGSKNILDLRGVELSMPAGDPAPNCFADPSLTAREPQLPIVGDTSNTISDASCGPAATGG